MMGRLTEQEALFYEFRLEDRVPADHLLRRVDAILDLGFVREHLATHYSRLGRPSIDPELMVRMLLLGYLCGIRSERRLCEEVDLHLAYRWFCRLGLDGRVPDHSTFTKNRHGRFRESGVMREVFQKIVAQCFAEGFASSDHVAVDGSFIRADASCGRHVANVEGLSHEDAPRAVRDYLADLDGAVPDLAGVQRSKPKVLSATDPAAAFSRKHGPATFAYGMNAMIDTGSGFVLEVCAAPERFADEPAAARRMVELLQRRHGVLPKVLTADKAYGAGPFLAWLEEREIQAHIPLIDRRHQTKGHLTRDAFVYNATSDSYTCPQGATLKRYASPPHEVLRYRSSSKDCGSCPIKPSCTTYSMRTVSRSPHEAVRERVLARAGTDAFRRSISLRKGIERLFACIKHNDGFQRVRLRGLRGAEEQFLMLATVRNLRRLVARTAVPAA